MKGLKSVVAVILVAVCGVSSLAQGSKDPKAKALLDEISNKYKTFTTFEAEFVYTLKSSVQEMNEEYEGKITVKGDKYHIVAGSETEIYNDNVKVWNYLKEDNEVDIYCYDPEEDEMAISKVVNMYKTGHKYILMQDEVVNGKKTKVVDLSPDVSAAQMANEQVFKIRMWIDSSTKQIVKWKIFEKNGNRYTYAIKKFTTNVSVTDASFVFDKSKHKGVEVVDMCDE